MLDTYKRPPEEQQAALVMQLRKFYPNLEFGRLEWINAQTHVVIDDLSYHSNNPGIGELVSKFESSCIGKVKVYSLAELTRDLEQSMIPFLETCDPQRTLIVFPGEGSETVKNILSQELQTGFRSLVVAARRVKNQAGEVVGTALPWQPDVLNTVVEPTRVDTFIVIDDVIDSGRTLQAVRDKLSHPNAAWYAAAPVIFSPLAYGGRTSFPSSIDGYQRIFASVILQEEVHPTPCNSLSSFVEGGEKTDRLVKKCLEEYAKPEMRSVLLDSLLQLRTLLGYT